MNFCNDFCYGKICFAKIDIKCPFTMEGRTSEIKAFDVNSKLSENLASHINIFKKRVPFWLHSFLFEIQVSTSNIRNKQGDKKVLPKNMLVEMPCKS